MDTKLKNIKYSMAVKATAFILVWLCFMIACGSGAFLAYNHDVVTNKNYFCTSAFKTQFLELTNNVVEYNIKLKSEKDIKASSKKTDIVQNNLAHFRNIKINLSSTVNFLYYIKNTNTNKFITNIKHNNPFDFIKHQYAFINLNKSDAYFAYTPYYAYGTYGGDYITILSGTPYEAYTAIRKPLKSGDVFYTDYNNYTKTKAISFYIIILLAVSISLTLICSIYLAFVCGRKERKGSIQLLLVDKLYTDVYTSLILIAAGMSIDIVSSLSLHDYIGIFIILGLDVLIGLSYILSMIKQLKNKTIIRNSLFYRMFKYIKELIKLCFSGKVFKISTIILLLAYGFINTVLIFITLMATRVDPKPLIFMFCTFLLLAFNIFAINTTVKALSSLTKLMSNVKEISNGNLNQGFDKNEISIAFLDFAKDIESIKSGLKKAVDTAVKGERMKTELITNVSHDLKTPLTSIVNYVDLLKKEDLDNQNAANYINILEEKSARLKQLIEDLVEASKASSGNLTVNPEKINLHELIMQACGEYEEKLKKVGLEIHIKTDEQKTLVNADGRHMWRIIENLLTNVVKYSMTNSRVYINIDKNDTYGMLIIKNISAVPLDIPPEQLTERFVRGDISRNTEGSGLGLSIAQSLTNLQNGSFKIDIDGDLFKVIIVIPLWTE